MEKSESKDELLMLYQVTCADLVYFKSQQWLVVNYTILAFAALVGISQIFKSNADGWFLAAFAVSTFVFSKMMIRSLNVSILDRRARLDACRRLFGDDFRAAWEAGTERDARKVRGKSDHSTQANTLFYDALHWALNAAFALTVGLLIFGAWPR